MNNHKWEPDFKLSWYEVDIEAYKIIYKEAKERMEEVLSESESITNKSIRFIIALVAVSGYFFNIFINKELSPVDIFCLLLFFLVPLIVFFFLVFPKNVKMRGFMPKEFLPEKIHSAEDKGFQEHILLYNAIVNLQNDITYMNIKNSTRAHFYMLAMVLSILMFIVYVLFTSLSGNCS